VDGTNRSVERGLKFPVYVENPNRPLEKDGAWDAKWFDSGYRVTTHQNELACGCPGEMRCIHYEWPEDDEPADESTEMDVVGLAVEGEAGVAREQIEGGVDSGVDMGQHSQQVRPVQQVEQALGHSIMGELQQGDPDVGMVRMDAGQPSEGGTAQREQHRLSDDNGMVMQYQRSPPTQEHMLQAATGQSNREMTKQDVHQPQRNLPAREEHYDLARQALDVMQSLEPPQGENLSTFEKAVENSHASRKFSLHLGGRRGNSVQPVKGLE
jgi:hypothetical protein